MILIGGGLESRASQRCRNSCLTVEMENGVSANYWANRNAPTMLCPGAGCRDPFLPMGLLALEGDDLSSRQTSPTIVRA
jgi:hypothetical protein